MNKFGESYSSKIEFNKTPRLKSDSMIAPTQSALAYGFSGNRSRKYHARQNERVFSDSAYKTGLGNRWVLERWNF